MLFALLLWIALLGFAFAKAEIEIEGGAGWAANLPTWRIERHPVLDWVWGGRPLTGYHVWVFSFMALVFHLPLFLAGAFSLRLEARVLGSLALFWVIEDFLWFVMNPAFGLARFRPGLIPWHKRWIGPVPGDYVVFGAAGAALILGSFA